MHLENIQFYIQFYFLDHMLVEAIVGLTESLRARLGLWP